MAWLDSHTETNPLFRWSLELATGEVHPGADEFGELAPLPELTEGQILNWMAAFAAQATEPRMQILLAAALRYPAPKVRFREVLSVNPQASSEWSNYFDQRRRAILVDWLTSLGIEPEDEVH